MSDQPAPRWKKTLDQVLWWLMPVAVALAAVFAVWSAWSLHHYGTSSAQGTRIFYDQYHAVRHMPDGKNERGRWDYHHVSGYHEFVKALERHGYQVTVHRHGEITPGMLDDYDIFFIGEQTQEEPWDAPKMTPEEHQVLFDWIRDGGGMWATIEHTNAHGMTDWFNPWMEGTGIQARYDSICEPNGTEVSRDWVELRTDPDHPLSDGVEVIYTCNGCSLDTEHGYAFSSPESWSDAWTPDDPTVFNGDNIRQPDELGGPLVGIAATEYGKGRIITTCDHNLFSNPTLYTGDHYQFLLNAMAWLGQQHHTNPGLYSLPLALLLTLLFSLLMVRKHRWYLVFVPLVVGLVGGVWLARDHFEEPNRRDILVTDTHSPDLRVRSKDPQDLFTFYEHIMKDEDTYAWLKRELEPGFDALYLNSPTVALSEADLAVVDGYLDQGRTVVYLASQGSMSSPAGEQLLDRFGVEVQLFRRSDRNLTRVYDIVGDSALTRKARTMRVPPPIKEASIRGEGVEVLVRLERGEHGFDFIAAKPVSKGRLVVVAQADLLGNANIRKKDYRMSAVDLSMNLAAWSVGRR